MIADLLWTGAANARTGRELAEHLETDLRDITSEIQRERRQGQPICANAGGYYLAENPEELQAYCDGLKQRAIELFNTRQALLKTLRRISREGAPES